MQAIRYAAAGGVVREGEHVLVLRRPSRDEVRLPKGHVEQGESLQEAALREVIEESGYADLEIGADLGHQVVEFDYQRPSSGKRESHAVHVVRDEHYFLMRLCSQRRIEREAQEQQFIPDWLKWDKALSELTFEAEREWVRRARNASS